MRKYAMFASVRALHQHSPHPLPPPTPLIPLCHRPTTWRLLLIVMAKLMRMEKMSLCVSRFRRQRFVQLQGCP